MLPFSEAQHRPRLSTLALPCTLDALVLRMDDSCLDQQFLRRIPVLAVSGRLTDGLLHASATLHQECLGCGPLSARSWRAGPAS